MKTALVSRLEMGGNCLGIRWLWLALLCLGLVWVGPVGAQSLLNVDFGVGSRSAKTGPAATGQSTNDFWNLYRHYDPRFVPGTPLVSTGLLSRLKLADGSDTEISLAVSNAPGVWGNATGDPMYDGYLFAPDGGKMLVTVSGLSAGRHHLFLYGHADADVAGEQNSVFTLAQGTNIWGPLAAAGTPVARAGQPVAERLVQVVFRDVEIQGGLPLLIEVAPGLNGIAVLNGLQLVSRGTSPPRLAPVARPSAAPGQTNILFQMARFDGRISDSEVRFQVMLEFESLATNTIRSPLFEGDVALLAGKLPAGVSLIGQGRQTWLQVERAGAYALVLELLPRITRQEPWNQLSFLAPPATIAPLTAQAEGVGVELQMLSGTPLGPEKAITNRVSGFLGGDRLVSLRWQGRTAEVVRKSLLTADTTVNLQVTPSVIKYQTAIRYEILQAPVSRLSLELPLGQALTSLKGAQIRDWQITNAAQGQRLVIEFLQPVDKSYELTLLSEQPVDVRAPLTTLVPPAPLEVQRETGTLSLTAEEMQVEMDSTRGARQVNATATAVAAYRFSGRPLALTARLKRVEPVLRVVDRATVRMEESRVMVLHQLHLNVEKTAIYSLDLLPPAGWVVTDVKGEGVEDWKTDGGRLRVAFGNRVLGQRKIDVSMEQAHRQVPPSLTVTGLTIADLAEYKVILGAAAAPGIHLKTREVESLREIPAHALTNRVDELLAFQGEQTAWRLVLEAEKQAARVVADVFNLITIGDGLVGGSATIRLGIYNQGVQEFNLRLPAHWRDVDFVGANIRRKELRGETNGKADQLYTVTLQDKAWGAYTLLITYDYQFDPKGAVLNLAGAHLAGVERESGSVGIMSGASLKLAPATQAEGLRKLDEGELSEADRSLCLRPPLLVYKYSGSNYRLSLPVNRFEEIQVLDAVADRTELTTVLTEAGQMLTQASFMVKNNDRQFQRFKLPPGAKCWSCYVNGQSAKPETDGQWLQVALPRNANRDQTYAVDMVYAQNITLSQRLWPARLQLVAPATDLPNTYAEWQIFAPGTFRLSDFGGNMSVARGTTYDLQDAWSRFVEFYGNLVDRNRDSLAVIIVLLGVAGLLVAAVKRGAQGLVSMLVLLVVLAVLGGMLLPALSKAKAKSQRISVVNNLKQVGLAARIWANDNGELLPDSFEAMRNELGTDKVLIDPRDGQRLVYVGSGKRADNPYGIIAYSPSDANGRVVAFADGSVQQVNEEKFQEALQRDAAIPRVNNAGQVLNAAANSPSAAQVRSSLPSQQPAPMAQADAVRAVAAAPLHSLRIDVPRSGNAFSFTKVLTGNEALAVSVRIMPDRWYRYAMMLVQLAMFLTGLVLVWQQSARSVRGNFWFTVGLALVLGGVGSLFHMWRVLHIVLIVLLPVLVLAGLGYLVWAWRRRHTVWATPAVTALALLAAVWVPASATAGTAWQDLGGTNAVTLTHARFEGLVRDRLAQLDVTCRIQSTSTNQVLSLFGDDVAVSAFTPDDGLKLWRSPGGVGIFVPQPTNATIKLRLVVKVGGDVTRQRLAFALPAALASEVDLALDEAEAEVDFPSAVAFARTATNQQTRVTAVLGGTARFELLWTPRVKRAAEIAATVFCQQAALVSFGGGVCNTRASLDYHVSQGETRQLRVALPDGQRLLRVEGEVVRSWEIRPEPGKTNPVLHVELIRNVPTTFKILLELEQVMNATPWSARIDLPQPLDVKRETGLIALRASEELALAVEPAAELQRVEGEEFPRLVPDWKEGLAGVFRYVQHSFNLTVRAESVQPQVELASRHHFRVGARSTTLNAQLDYTIKRAGVFRLSSWLPSGWRLVSVAGPAVQQWAEKTEAGGRGLEVSLKQRTLGSCPVTVVLEREYSVLPRKISLAGLSPVQAAKHTGFVSVGAEYGVAVKTDTFTGLMEIPPAQAGVSLSQETSGTLAFKFVSAGATAAPAWQLEVGTESVEAWVRAETLTRVNVTENLVSGRTLVRYDIANAPVKEFTLRIPGTLGNVDISGANLRRRDQTGEVWRVELQSPARGSHVLTVTWEMPRNALTNTTDLSGIQALKVERETGFLVLQARAPLQVSVPTVSDLLTRVDLGELPDWAGRVDSTAVLAYRYVRPGWRLGVAARRFEEAEVLSALIDSARFTTVVADDGQSMTEMVLSVRNKGRQHLEVEMPQGATVWSVFVSGQAVRPGHKGARLLVPLEKNSAPDTSTSVEIISVGREVFPRDSGEFGLFSPGFDAPLKNARWDLFLPPEFEYTPRAGTMVRTVDIAVAPQVQVFSLSEYSAQEQGKLGRQQAEVRAEITEVQRNLKGGNVREAIGVYNRTRAKQQRADENSDDLRQIEVDLRRVQSSNLIGAQNAWYADNSVRINGGAVPLNESAQQSFTVPAAVNYDAEIAGLQWEKMAQAQKVAETKVVPLRVNLPTRGVKLSFTQVLQTELNQPMSIRLNVSSTRTNGWGSRVWWSGLAFLALWGIVALARRSKPVAV